VHVRAKQWVPVFLWPQPTHGREHCRRDLLKEKRGRSAVLRESIAAFMNFTLAEKFKNGRLADLTLRF
jgi:hypothetical protein